MAIQFKRSNFNDANEVGLQLGHMFRLSHHSANINTQTVNRSHNFSITRRRYLLNWPEVDL